MYVQNFKLRCCASMNMIKLCSTKTQNEKLMDRCFKPSLICQMHLKTGTTRSAYDDLKRKKIN